MAGKETILTTTIVTLGLALHPRILGDRQPQLDAHNPELFSARSAHVRSGDKSSSRPAKSQFASKPERTPQRIRIMPNM
jgi:hypothetical protein